MRCSKAATRIAVRRATLLAILLVIGSRGAPVAGEEMLLSLPKEFDVRASGGWGQYGNEERRRISREDLEGEAGVFRFRGERVTQRVKRTDRHDYPSCQVHISTEQELQGTFRRGVLRGRWVSRQRNFYRSCHDRDDGEYLRSRDEGAVTGQADVDGLLKLTVHVTEGEIVDHKMDWVGEANEGRFVYRGWAVRDQPHEPWSFGLELQLPVGELQSSQELSAPPPPGSPGVPPPAAPEAPGDEPPGFSGSGPPPEPSAPARPPEDRFGRPVEGIPADARPRQDPPEDEPATAAETAGATIGSGLLLGIGAWLMARANGTGLGDLLGGLGEWLEDQPPSESQPEVQPEAAPPPPAPPMPVPEPPPADGGTLPRGDVPSDAGPTRPPDDLGEVAREIVAGDRRIAARAEEIAQRDEELRRESEKIHEESERLGLDPQGQALQGLFDEHQEEFARQGYRVLNPGYDQALPIREVVDAGAWVSSWVRSGQAVRCEQFADLGKEALEKSLRERFGAEADGFIVDSVVIDVARDDSWGGRAEAFLDVVAPKNHVATRVVLPDGRRFVLDHWDASRGTGRRMLSEEEWFERWRGRMGEDTVFTGSGDFGQQMREERLQEAVTEAAGQGGSEEQGLAKFREEEVARIQGGAGTEAEKAVQIRKVETLARSFERCGGLRPGTGGAP